MSLPGEGGNRSCNQHFPIGAETCRLIGQTSISPHWRSAAQVFLVALLASMVLYTVVDAAPVVRDLCRFNVYFYQIRQLESAHDLSEAQALEQFALPALVLTDKWLGLRIERMKLRLGTHLGGSDKAAFLAVMVGAWTIWHNFPRSRSAFEQYLYMLGGAFPGGVELLAWS